MVLRKGDKEIKILYEKDYQALHLLGCCCNVSVEELKDIGLSNNRINTYIRSGIVEYGQSENEDYVRTTISGRSYIEENTSIGRCYASNSREHDSKLVEVYNSLTDTEKETWQTERELKTIADENDVDMNDKSPTDAAYTSDNGDYICIEIVTGNYSEADIEEKESFAASLGGSYEQY